MKIKQIIISIFFLFVYSLSFAHSLIPHVNGFYSEHFPDVRTENEIEHLHQHHCETPKESCIKHNDHCDDNLFDLLICLFSNINPHHSDFDVEFNSNHNHKRINVSSLDLSLKTIHSKFSFFTEFELDQRSINNEFYYYLNTDYSSPPIKNAPHRGPPSIS